MFLGHTRNISIPDCVEFKITTNACRGFCESWSLPSIMLGFKRHPVTSLGQCCNIMESEDVRSASVRYHCNFTHINFDLKEYFYNGFVGWYDKLQIYQHIIIFSSNNRKPSKLNCYLDFGVPGRKLKIFKSYFCWSSNRQKKNFFLSLKASLKATL